MGSILFECECGSGRFLTSTDNRSYAAHLLADQDYDAFSQILDDAIEKSGPSRSDKEKACMTWRSFSMPMIWQCPSCGSVYIEDAERQRHRFVPSSSEVSKGLFKRRDT